LGGQWAATDERLRIDLRDTDERERFVSFDVLAADDSAWPRILSQLPHDVYHLPGYARVCATHEPWPVRLAVASGHGHTAVLPFMTRALPMGASGCDITVPYGYPGPVCSTDEPLIVEALLGELFDGFLEMGAVSAFIRCHPFLGVSLEALRARGEVVVHGDQVFLDLATAPHVIETSFRPGHRQNIAALKRDGFTIRVDAPEDAQAFPALYARNMRRLDADPYYHFPAAYFDAIRDHLGPNAHFITALSPDGDIAAIALLFVCEAMGQYHLSCTEDRFLRLAPSKLTILGMAELCRSLGVTTLNLGGGVGAQHDSLLAFKAGFSSARVKFATARVILDADAYARLSRGVQAPEGFFPAYRVGL